MTVQPPKGASDSEIVGRAARVARIVQNSARYQAEGVCAVCHLVVPVRVTEKQQRTASHWPDDPADSYDENPSYYCRGSNEEPKAIFEPVEPVARISVSAETMALLMDGAADELEGRVSVVAIAWRGDTSRDDAHRLTRAWAAKIGEKPVVSATRIRCYGDHRLEAVA